jgi:hypothetical protein
MIQQQHTRLVPMIERYCAYLVEAKTTYKITDQQIQLMQKKGKSEGKKEILSDFYKGFGNTEERSVIQAAQHLLLAQQLGKLDRFCPVCHMTTEKSAQKSNCFCKELIEIRDSEKLERGLKLSCPPIVNLKISLYMHYKELSHMRVSNTGRILIHSCPEISQFYVCNVPHDEEKLVDQLRSDGLQNCAILFPALDEPETRSLDEFLNSWSQKSVDPEQKSSQSQDSVLHLVLFDATWTGAKHLHKRMKKLLPEANRIALTNHELEKLEILQSNRHKHKIRDYSGLSERGGTLSILLESLLYTSWKLNLSNSEAIESLNECSNLHISAYHSQTNHQKQ